MASITTTMQNTQPETYSKSNIFDVIKKEFPVMSKKFQNIQVGDMLIGNKGWHSRITEVGSSIKLEEGDPPKINNYEKTWIVISEKNYKRFYNPKIVNDDGNLNIYLLGYGLSQGRRFTSMYELWNKVVVVAKDEHDARVEADEDHKTTKYPQLWLDESQTFCEKIGEANKDQREGIVCYDFLDG